jgi:putative ribosome biogenesis GTPase RsgA
MEYAGIGKGSFVFSILAGTTDEKTYTVRVGDTAGQNTTMNTSVYYGAATAGEEITTLTIKEIEV